MFFCDADPRLQPRDGATELATFACAPPTDGGPQPYTHLSDHYGISTTLRVMNDVCWHHSQVRDRGNHKWVRAISNPNPTPTPTPNPNPSPTPTPSPSLPLPLTLYPYPYP